MLSRERAASMQLERQISAGCRFIYNRPLDQNVYNNRYLGIKELPRVVDAFPKDHLYHPNAYMRQEVRVVEMPAAPKEKKIRRPVIDRAYYRSEEFKKQFAEAIDTAMEDPEYLENIRVWDVTVGDGVSDRGISQA
jgi:hypothetical protein